MTTALGAAALGLAAAACSGTSTSHSVAAPLTAAQIAAKLDCTGIMQDTTDDGLQYTKEAIQCSEPAASQYSVDTILTFATRAEEESWASMPSNGGSAVVGPLWVVVPSTDNNSYPNYEPWVAHVIQVLGAGRDESLGP
jgi:hypothetical protein